MAISFPFVLILRAAFISFYILRYNLGDNIKYGNIILNCDHCGLSRDYFTGCCLECGMELC